MKKAKCEICERNKYLNRYGICDDCYNDADHSPIYDIDPRDYRLRKYYSSSYQLKDIIPYAEKGLDDESIENIQSYYRKEK
ncbi:MAG TPA: hypothetical protein VH815_10375 [Acidobacteriota bacterium]|jgi:hypothetical protein